MRAPFRRFSTAMPSTLALAVCLALGKDASAGPALPVPCAGAGACGAAGPAQFVTSGTATAVATQNALTVNQKTNSAILNWSYLGLKAFQLGDSFNRPGQPSACIAKL